MLRNLWVLRKSTTAQIGDLSWIASKRWPTYNHILVRHWSFCLFWKYHMECSKFLIMRQRIATKMCLFGDLCDDSDSIQSQQFLPLIYILFTNLFFRIFLLSINYEYIIAFLTWLRNLLSFAHPCTQSGNQV